jgi:uncharacterized protein (DUF1330 family)
MCIEMSRGLILFLFFLTVLLFGFGVAAYIAGPDVLSFVFHSERRTQPVVMVDLLEFTDADHEQRYVDEFRRPAAALIEAVGGKSVWRAATTEPIGVRTARVVVDIARYPSRAVVTGLVTSKDYRALLPARASAIKTSAVFEATELDDFDAASARAAAVRLLAGSNEDSLERFDAEWASQDATVLARHDGRAVWRARLRPLVADDALRFEAVVVYGFPNAQRREAWLDDRERLTLTSLERKLFARDVLLLTRTPAETATR